MVARLPNALLHHQTIIEHLGGRSPVVFLDYDGTLTPIVARPELALLDERIRATLERLSRVATTAIVSGRACADVRTLIGIDSLHYAGNHGLEIEGPGGVSHRRIGEQYREEVQAFARDIAARLRGIDGVIVENKDLTLSVHYRLADPTEVPAIETHVDELLSRCPNLHKRHGKKVLEIRPRVDWNKGKAIMWLLQTLAATPESAIYLGDDVTDEDAFLALQGRGLGVRVGDSAMASAADYSLEDTDEVRQFLEMLIAVATPT